MGDSGGSLALIAEEKSAIFLLPSAQGSLTLAEKEFFPQQSRGKNKFLCLRRDNCRLLQLTMNRLSDKCCQTRKRTCFILDFFTVFVNRLSYVFSELTIKGYAVGIYHTRRERISLKEVSYFRYKKDSVLMEQATGQCVHHRRRVASPAPDFSFNSSTTAAHRPKNDYQSFLPRLRHAVGRSIPIGNAAPTQKGTFGCLWVGAGDGNRTRIFSLGS